MPQHVGSSDPASHYKNEVTTNSQLVTPVTCLWEESGLHVQLSWWRAFIGCIIHHRQM